MSEDAKRPFTFLTVPPNLRGLFHVIRGCAGLPKESAENKKMFTRLWVHEALRSFYDRMTQKKHMDEIFSSIKGCVKTIFKENFDSAFEHLGKVDGRVYIFLRKRLLFFSYQLFCHMSHFFVGDPIEYEKSSFWMLHADGRGLHEHRKLSGGNGLRRLRKGGSKKNSSLQ